MNLNCDLKWVPRFFNKTATSVSDALSSPLVTRAATAAKGLDFFNPSPTTSTVAPAPTITAADPDATAPADSAARAAAVVAVIATFLIVPVATVPLRWGLTPFPISSAAPSTNEAARESMTFGSFCRLSAKAIAAACIQFPPAAFAGSAPRLQAIQAPQLRPS